MPHAPCYLNNERVVLDVYIEDVYHFERSRLIYSLLRMYQKCPSLCAGISPRRMRFLTAWQDMPSICAMFSTLHTVSSESMTICLSSSTVIFRDLLPPLVHVAISLVVKVFHSVLADDDCHFQVLVIMIMNEEPTVASSCLVVTRCEHIQ